MIEVSDLRKVFGELAAVDGITFTAEPGAIFGLLGPNGAGKTTTISCVCGLLKPTSGRVRVLGYDVVTDGARAKSGLGVVPQEVAIYEEVSATENLRYWGGAYGLTGAGLKTRIAEVLELTGLQDRAKEPVKRFSGGMKRRLNFACGIVHRPKVLLLDEPTVGVDPQSRVRLLELVREEAVRGTCVVYTTHYMQEAEELCDRLAIVDHGKLIAYGSLDRTARHDRRAGHSPAFWPVRAGSRRRGPVATRRRRNRAERRDVPVGVARRRLAPPPRGLRRAARGGLGHPRNHDHATQPRKPLHQAHRQRAARVTGAP